MNFSNCGSGSAFNLALLTNRGPDGRRKRSPWNWTRNHRRHRDRFPAECAGTSDRSARASSGSDTRGWSAFSKRDLIPMDRQIVRARAVVTRSEGRESVRAAHDELGEAHAAPGQAGVEDLSLIRCR